MVAGQRLDGNEMGMSCIGSGYNMEGEVSPLTNQRDFTCD